jgi:acetaldehyde dehydrogenase/alcohol dehydrogenase
MAFSNAFLGVNHSLAHKLGGEFHIPHGRANAVLLPHVIAYNAQKPTKFAIFPKYGEFVADYRYAQIARQLGLAGKDETQAQQVEALIEAVKALMRRLNMPMSIKACGVDEAAFLKALPGLSERAFEDQCTTANPRYPLISELSEIYKKAYYGE